MKTKHKYLRNQHYNNKHYKRAKRILPIQDFWLWIPTWCKINTTVEEYINEEYLKHLKWREKTYQTWKRVFDKGYKPSWSSPPKWFRKEYNDRLRAAERRALKKDYYTQDEVYPSFKRNIRWDWL